MEIKHLSTYLAGTKVSGTVSTRDGSRTVNLTVKSRRPKDCNKLIVEDDDTGRVSNLPISDVLHMLVNFESPKELKDLNEITGVSVSAHTEACRLAAEVMALSPDIPEQVLEDIADAKEAIGRAQIAIKRARQIAQSRNWDREDYAKETARRGMKF